MILPADHPERIHAVIPVTDVVMILVRLVLLKITQDHIQQQPNAGQDVTDVKTVLQEVRLIPVLMSVLPNAEAAMPAMTHVNPGKNPFLVLQRIKR